MWTFWKWAVVLVLPAVWLVEAWPQERVIPEGTTVKLLLLRQKSVQQELKLTPKAIKKIMAFTHAQSEAARKASEMEDAQRKEAFDKLRKENKQFLAGTLTAKQGKRLDQITMQFTAFRHLAKPEIAKKLSLTEEQQQKFKSLQKEARAEMAELIGAKNSEGRNEKFAKLRDKARTQILALLTDDQKAIAREMAGPPFMGEIVVEDGDAPKEK